MRSNLLHAAGILTLYAASQAAKIPAKDIIVSRGIQLLTPDTDMSVRNWTRFDIPNSLSSTSHSLVSIPQTAVVVAVLYTNAQIVESVCSATAALGPGGIAVCGIIAIAAIVNSFFTLFRSSTGPAGTPNPVRSIEAPDMLIHSAFQPTAACDTVCQLRAHTAYATWTSIGNVSMNGVFHDFHFSQVGKILGLRAVQGVPGNTKRDDIDDDGGIVAAYFWEDNNNQTVWNDFDRSAIPFITDSVAAFIVQNNAPIICGNLVDQDGAVNAGMFSIDSNNDELAFQPGDSYNEALAFCLSGDPNIP